MPGIAIKKIFRLTTHRKSRAMAMCGKIGRCQEEIEKKLDFTQSELNRRISGQSITSGPKKERNIVSIKGKGRYDVCVAPMALTIGKTITTLVISDMFLRNKNAQLQL